MRSRDENVDVERALSPEPLGRRRTMSGYGGDGRQDGSRAGTRESNATGRLRNAVGSLEERSNTNR